MDNPPSELSDLTLPEFVRTATPFTRCTDRARRVMRLAEEQAIAMGCIEVEPVHILLGMAREKEGIAGVVLRRFHADFAGILRAWRAVSLAINGSQSPSTQFGKPKWGVEVIGLESIATEERKLLSHDYIGTEHLLLAIARLTTGVVPAVLAECGIRPDRIREEVYSILGHDLDS